jgi:anti-sigma factor RsiW
MTRPLRLLAAHALGALPAADGEALERHLAGCAASVAPRPGHGEIPAAAP